mgnify:CR=1 FL=1
MSLAEITINDSQKRIGDHLFDSNAYVHDHSWFAQVASKLAASPYRTQPHFHAYVTLVLTLLHPNGRHRANPGRLLFQYFRSSHLGMTPTPNSAWQPDSGASECPLCSQEFTTFKRRHHCRRCGRVVCHECSKRSWIPHSKMVSSRNGATWLNANREMPRAPQDYTHRVRICDDCAECLVQASFPPAIVDEGMQALRQVVNPSRNFDMKKGIIIRRKSDNNYRKRN